MKVAELVRKAEAHGMPIRRSDDRYTIGTKTMQYSFSTIEIWGKDFSIFLMLEGGKFDHASLLDRGRGIPDMIKTVKACAKLLHLED